MQIVPLTLDPDAPYEELEPLAGLVGDARVVAIGESAHLVHEFYDLRHRLTRFLVERLGFSAVVYESGWSEGLRVNEWIHGGPGTVEEMQRGYVTWSMGLNDETRDQLNWLRAFNGSGGSVSFYGMDLPSSQSSLLPALDPVGAYLDRVEPAFVERFARLRELAASYAHRLTDESTERFRALPEADRNEVAALLAATESQLEGKRLNYSAATSPEEFQIARRCLRNAVQLDRTMRWYAGLARGDEPATGSNPRDAGMWEHIEWVLEREERIVVVAHNGHIQRAPVGLGGMTPMSPVGHYLADALGDGYVAIGSTFGSGELVTFPDAQAQVTAVGQPGPDTVDGLLASIGTGSKPFLVGLRGLTGEDAAAVDARTAIRGNELEWDVEPRQAFDVLAYIPTVTIWHKPDPLTLIHEA
jgi:erythromycin esterase